MKIAQSKWSKAQGWTLPPPGPAGPAPGFVLVFGDKATLLDPVFLCELDRLYPQTCLFGCSTAGEICGTTVSDASVVVTAVTFAHSRWLERSVQLDEANDSSAAGRALAGSIPPLWPGPDGGPGEPLVHVLVLADGQHVNGSQLVAGLTAHLPPGTAVTGGLAGDGVAFGETVVFVARRPRTRAITALALYGPRLRIGFGSLGGWDPFGPERLITRAKANILYELDGQSALGLYKKYLGAHAAELPSSGLLFPLSIRTGAGDTPLVRTILAVNEREQSLTFAGDMPEGAYARLMKANFDRLIDGASGAARASYGVCGTTPPPAMAILISCVGRKIVLGQRIEEEVEGVAEVLGPATLLTGFYSYGEISPFAVTAPCALHNQTMTITTLSEV